MGSEEASSLGHRLEARYPLALVLPLKSSSVDPAKLDTPETKRFATDSNTSFGQEIFNMAVAQVEPIVEPNGVGDDIGWGAPSRNRWRL